MADERQRLRVVHDHDVMVDMVAHRVLIADLLVYLHLEVGELDIGSLQGVVHLLGDAEEFRSALNHPPAGLDANGIHQQRQRRQNFRDAAAVIGRVYVDDVHVAEAPRLLDDALDSLRSDQRLVVLHPGKPEALRIRVAI
jgi:hypothetical protein